MAAVTTPVSDRWWHRGLTLAAGCVIVCFGLIATNLVLYERELAAVTPAANTVRAGVIAGPLQARVRGGRASAAGASDGTPAASQPRGELARGVARLKGQLQAVAEGRRIDDVACVAVADLARALGGELDQATPDGPATILCDAGMIEIAPGTQAARVNYASLALTQAPVAIDGQLYVPVRSLEQMAGLQVTWDEKSRRFQLAHGDSRVEVVILEDQFEIEIDRSDRTLQIRYLGQAIATWKCCVAEGGNTPVGTFHIQNKAAWAAWRSYSGEHIPGGSRRNPLGARWLGTTARGRETGRAIGIHGTNQPSSIGTRISGGCVRLTNAHSIEMFNTIPVGTRVIVHE